MVKLDKVFFEMIADKEQKNCLFSPFWIYLVKKLFVKGKYYLKIYLVINDKSIKDLQSLNFQLFIKGDTQIEIECFEFHPVTTIKNKYAMGSILEVSELQYKLFNEIIIKSYKTSQDEVFIEGPQTVIALKEDQLEIEKNKYLSHNTTSYNFFPNVDKSFWQCSCGALNKPASDQCYNCDNDFNDIKKMFDSGLDNLFLEVYFNKNKINFDTSISVDKNIEQLVERLKVYGISKEQILAQIVFSDVYKSYELAHPIKIDYKKDAKQNVDDYYKLLDNLGIKQVNINPDLFDTVNNKIIAYKTKKKKITRLAAIITAVTALIFITVFTIPYARYAFALNNLNNEKYEKAAESFRKLDNLLNSEEHAKEATYLQAIDLSKTNYFDASRTMSSLKNYKDAVNLSVEYKYLGAIDISSTNLLKASDTMLEIGHYKDAKDKFTEYKYGYIKELFDNEEYGKATLHLGHVKKYKDIEEINDVIYAKLGDDQVAKNATTNALDFYAKMNDKTKYNDLSYSHAIDLYNKDDLRSARNIFLKIKDYKDSNSKIEAIERIIFKTEIELTINNNKNGHLHDENVSLYYSTPIYFHARVTNARPGETIKLKYKVTWPNGATDYAESFPLEKSESYWQSWQWDSVYNAPKGTVTFNVYDVATGEHLGTQTSNMR